MQWHHTAIDTYISLPFFACIHLESSSIHNHVCIPTVLRRLELKTKIYKIYEQNVVYNQYIIYNCESF